MKKKFLVLLTTLVLLLGLAGCGGTMATCNFCGEEAKCKTVNMDEREFYMCKDCQDKAKNGEDVVLGGY